jgi:hypothetical protein
MGKYGLIPGRENSSLFNGVWGTATLFFNGHQKLFPRG